MRKFFELFNHNFKIKIIKQWSFFVRNISQIDRTTLKLNEAVEKVKAKR